MAVGSLVQKLIGGLQIKIGSHMLGHEHSHGNKDQQDKLWHGRYLLRASAPPSQFGGGGMWRKKAMRSR